MGHMRKTGAPLLRWLQIKLFLLSVLAGLSHLSLGINQVTKSVNEMAALSCDYNISVSELVNMRIYWQKDQQMVLSIISEQVEVWPEYKNRTFPDIINNLSLVILALRLSDKGTYTCVVQKSENGVFEVVHLTSVTLLIRADFPSPSIVDVGDPVPNIKRIRCSASGGFPEPHLSWWEDGELSAVNTTVSQDLDTTLYTISSDLEFNVTKNHSIMCLIKYGDSRVSQTFTWHKPKPEPPIHEYPLWAIVLGSMVFIAAVIIFLIYRLVPRRERTRKNEETGETQRLPHIYIGAAQASG
ncbi:T-lymphocyte activation antigen CD80 [Ochotona princeps]|uniref:T-lymphocyte activation antigen CD80 n=1 Tax=Ochotona princeps TaxID=9978 RepID=UPI002714E0A2|nr:T-lymphocyte activation antigen CD80 [Ochotona princeps]XP_058517928.1 T-lymphocyte activation antigen CD80 [Ochotona princeps]